MQPGAGVVVRGTDGGCAYRVRQPAETARRHGREQCRQVREVAQRGGVRQAGVAGDPSDGDRFRSFGGQDYLGRVEGAVTGHVHET